MAEDSKNYFDEVENLYFHQKDYGATYELCLRGSKVGDLQCIRFMGWLYYHGHGCEIDKDEALKWFGKAAKNSDAESWAGIGYIYYDRKAYKKAFHYFELAANKGFGPAIVKVGLMYQHGVGVHKDFDKAVFYYKKAIAINHLVGWIAYTGFLIYGNRGLLGRLKGILLFIPTFWKTYKEKNKNPNSITFKY